MSIKEALTEITKSNDKFKFYLEHILSGEATDPEITETLVALNEYGIDYYVMDALASVMNTYVDNIELSDNDFIDTCGTGGSNLKIFNCSTISAFVVASCGGRVVKHGNKSITSKSGSADFLARAGVNINNDKSNAISAFNQFGITFLFAPTYHQRLKYVAAQRKALGVRTVFNVVGPLVNPANPNYQIIGTSDSQINEAVTNVLKNKGLTRAMVVTSNDGIDELSLTSNSSVYELNNGDISSYEINPEDYDLIKCEIDDIQVDTLEEAYLFGIEILNGKRGPGFDMVALNAGAALYISNKVESLSEGIEKAKRELHSGRPLLLLNKYAKFTNQL
jgi:anthranilate phosphoribosyltransferase